MVANLNGGRMAKNERTSKKVAKIAAKALRSKRSSKAMKTLAASALTQVKDKPKKRKR
jgi:hypothetical protein